VIAFQYALDLRSAIRPAARPDRNYVDHALVISAPEDDPPVADAKAPKALVALKAPHVASRQAVDR
jgi:hypothetical protein